MSNYPPQWVMDDPEDEETEPIEDEAQVALAMPTIGEMALLGNAITTFEPDFWPSFLKGGHRE